MAVLFLASFKLSKFDLAKLLPKWVYKKKKPKFAISSQFFFSFFLQCADITWYNLCAVQPGKKIFAIYYTLLSGSGPKITLRESGPGKVAGPAGSHPVALKSDECISEGVNVRRSDIKLYAAVVTVHFLCCWYLRVEVWWLETFF